MSYVLKLATKYSLEVRDQLNRLQFDSADAQVLLTRALNECITKCVEIVDLKMDPFDTADALRELRAKL